MELVVESARVADRFAVAVAPPQRGRGGVAVGADGAFSAGRVLQFDIGYVSGGVLRMKSAQRVLAIPPILGFSFNTQIADKGGKTLEILRTS